MEGPEAKGKLCRILALDGGGAKGFYTLGVLHEIEAMVERRLCERFDLIYGTSTGAIIASLLALGYSVDDIHSLYTKHVPAVMVETSAEKKTAALRSLAQTVFADAKFEDAKTGLGVIATRWLSERPMIFKSDLGQAHGAKATFKPGFGVLVADAIEASCSAFPFFARKLVTTADGDQVELIDGGYCANNPTLYAIADATEAMGHQRSDIRVVNIGVGVYPEPKPRTWKMWAARKMLSVQLLQKTLEINTQSMSQLRDILFNDVPTTRISDTFVQPEMATDLLEHDLAKLNVLRQRGRESFGAREQVLRDYLL